MSSHAWNPLGPWPKDLIRQDEPRQWPWHTSSRRTHVRAHWLRSGTKASWPARGCQGDEAADRVGGRRQERVDPEDIEPPIGDLEGGGPLLRGEPERCALGWSWPKQVPLSSASPWGKEPLWGQGLRYRWKYAGNGRAFRIAQVRRRSKHRAYPTSAPEAKGKGLGSTYPP